MTTTYKQFLIYPESLFCYLDQGGRMIPMFPSTVFTSVEEIKTRIDTYWNEFEQFKIQRDINLGKLWANMKEQLEPSDTPDDDREAEAEKFGNRVDMYYERELLEDRP